MNTPKHAMPARYLSVCLALLVALALALPSTALAQKSKKSKPPVDADKIEQAEKKAAEALAKKDAEPVAEPVTEPKSEPLELDMPNLLGLWFKGGPLMIPITLMSFIVETTWPTTSPPLRATVAAEPAS